LIVAEPSARFEVSISCCRASACDDGCGGAAIM
jgi:hypothetical protein